MRDVNKKRERIQNDLSSEISISKFLVISVLIKIYSLGLISLANTFCIVILLEIEKLPLNDIDH